MNFPFALNLTHVIPLSFAALIVIIYVSNISYLRKKHKKHRRIMVEALADMDKDIRYLTGKLDHDRVQLHYIKGLLSFPLTDSESQVPFLLIPHYLNTLERKVKQFEVLHRNKELELVGTVSLMITEQRHGAGIYKKPS